MLPKKKTPKKVYSSTCTKLKFFWKYDRGPRPVYVHIWKHTKRHKCTPALPHFMYLMFDWVIVIFILLHIWEFYLCFSELESMMTLYDAFHEDHKSQFLLILDITLVFSTQEKTLINCSDNLRNYIWSLHVFKKAYSKHGINNIILPQKFPEIFVLKQWRYVIDNSAQRYIDCLDVPHNVHSIFHTTLHWFFFEI